MTTAKQESSKIAVATDNRRQEGMEENTHKKITVSESLAEGGT